MRKAKGEVFKVCRISRTIQPGYFKVKVIIILARIYVHVSSGEIAGKRRSTSNGQNTDDFPFARVAQFFKLPENVTFLDDF